ncbi:hypothetical protein E6P09_15020 [Haloferax mediterranei ATCC 33500]|uniref:Uncharacterized protein n=1 Tax=Haloferax mediterranei (strain ATCC 33500 / DSM 1411 / JCM 8866 / NBRC 14739 / NCIMB 2177 / R-4) TaxID=523841 RepID=M0IU74_HALMT|nr:hypothetical protein [Haloferax mediterranei]AHZ23417.1 hypothetical protein BM92_12550 [Haloferax mediterranei ATCC 33500]ELZ99587.1 hypothetical protein C439_13574 [Haloferax mediterranei ATCC 33500]MDX5987209.1 hypothetical protein [Haloferax mediterranei ATCC 33500]QCQ76514.1 hypothetical protein E6P09_15020 [Haloferax mediterranei ATCC 33500]
MTHDNHPGVPDAVDMQPNRQDTPPNELDTHAKTGHRSLAETALLSLAAGIGIVAAAVAAALVAPFAPVLGLVTLFLGWPVGFVATVLALRKATHAVVKSGVPALARGALRRRRIPDPVVTDGGCPGEPCDCQ